VNTVVEMGEPMALADTVTPPSFSPAGDVTAPLRIEGSACGGGLRHGDAREQ